MTTVVSFETVDGTTIWEASVPTGVSPEDDALALMTHLQSTFGWKVDDIVLEMYEPGKYVILCEYIKRENIQELDGLLVEIYSHYNITEIGCSAYDGCTLLTAIAIPNSITAIGVNAFRGCTSLTTVDIPYSIIEIGMSAFYGCTSLTAIAIPDGM